MSVVEALGDGDDGVDCSLAFTEFVVNEVTGGTCS